MNLSLFIQDMLQPTDKAGIYVLVPVYNENSVLPQVLYPLTEKGYTIIVIDDGSLVPVASCIEHLPVILLRHKVNLGQGAALQTGVEFALSKNACFIVTFDGDGQHNADDIDLLVRTVQSAHADVVIGSRFLKHANQVPQKRRMLLQVARYVNYFFTGLLLTDAHNGLRAFTQNAARQITIQQNRMAHATELLWLIKKNKLKYIEVPVVVSYSNYSLKKGQHISDAFRIVFDLFLSKFFR